VSIVYSDWVTINDSEIRSRAVPDQYSHRNTLYSMCHDHFGDENIDF